MTTNPALRSYRAAQYWLSTNQQLDRARTALQNATYAYERAMAEELAAREMMLEELATDDEAEGEGR